MSRTSACTCLFLGQLLASSLAAAQPLASRTEPREVAESTAETSTAGRVVAPRRAFPPLAAVPEAPTPVRESAQPPSSPVPTASSWYGWQTLTTDGASALLMVMALSSSNGSSSETATAVAWLSVGTFVVGGPIVHFAHGNAGKGLGSLALRVGLPLVVGGLGAMAERTQCGGGDFCGVGGAFLGGLAGVVGTIAIDSTLLGYERVPAHADSVPVLAVAADGQGALVTARGQF